MLSAVCNRSVIVAGIAFYDDLNLPLLKCEASVFYSIVEQEAQSILPGTILQMVGGFRRLVKINDCVHQCLIGLRSHISFVFVVD